MEINLYLAPLFRAHYKKLLILGTASLTVYLIKKYMDNKKKQSVAKKGKKKIKDFPTIEEIQKFIEDLPFDAVNADKTITLKDLLGELSEFSEDEEWKELIASVHTMYEDNTAKIPGETGSNTSIYEDPNVIILRGTKTGGTNPNKTLIKDLDAEEVLKLSKGEGDTKITNLPDICGQKDETNDFEMLIKSSGDGDNTETEKSVDPGLVF